MRITGRPAGLIEGDLARRTEELVAEDGVGSAPDTAVDAFVSYSRRDASLVLPIVQAAERHGRSFWFDADDIPGGAAWREELAAAIETADAVVCFLSPAWSTSAECRREYDRAVELGKRLVPVLIARVTEAVGARNWARTG